MNLSVVMMKATIGIVGRFAMLKLRQQACVSIAWLAVIFSSVITLVLREPK